MIYFSLVSSIEKLHNVYQVKTDMCSNNTQVEKNLIITNQATTRSLCYPWLLPKSQFFNDF